jgi:hypothetical protein
MKFDYLQLADAMNVSPDGKVNVLGLGIRLLVFPQLPAASRFAVLANVQADLSEVGSHDAEFRLVAPDGTEQDLFRTSIDVNPDLDPEATIVIIGLGLDVVRPFTQEGRYIIRAKVGDVSAEYRFRVKVGSPGLAGPSEPAKSARRTAKAR